MVHPLERVRVLFDELTGLPSAECQARLEEVRQQEPDVVEELESLLDAHGQAQGFLETQETGPLDIGAGTRLGDWEVSAALGEGGMGQVYRVERRGKDFTQVAACKVLTRGWYDRDLIRLFRSERQSLARLEHPHIARLLDGGETAQGIPFYVMELVEGEPIDVYCERKGLSILERVQLILPVCAAVQHAHQSLVVHRDLKPGNVLVGTGKDDAPNPKLLDFGIAKLLIAGDSQSDDRTRTRWLTPHYASPEQIQGISVTTVSDVYSLGVLLYRLVTGQLPFEVAAEDPGAYERAVCNQDPIPARRRWANSRQAGIQDSPWPEDLEWVLRRALAVEPERRYASAEQFADDLRRLLAGHPVLARESTVRYQVRRFIGRNRALVAAATAGLLALMIALGGVLWSQQRTQAQADRVIRINDYLLELLRLPDPDLAGPNLTYLAAVERIASVIDQEFSDDPPVCASLHSQVGATLHRLGQSDSALGHLKQALVLQRETPGIPNVDLSETLLRLSEVQADRGELQASEDLAREALALRRDVPDPDPMGVARAESVLAVALLETDKLAEAEGLLLSTLDQYSSTDGPAIEPSLRVRAWNNLGLVHRLQGKDQEAEEAYTQAIELAGEQLPTGHPAHALALFNLGSALLRSDRSEEGRDMLAKCVELRETRLGPRHPNVALALNQLALAELQHGRPQPARKALERSGEILDGLDSRSDELIMTRLQGLDTYSHYLLQEREYDEAETGLRESLEGYASVVGEEHLFTDHARKNLAKPLYRTGQLEEARGLLERSLSGFDSRGAGESVSAAFVRSYLGDVYAGLGLREEALRELARAVEIFRQDPQRAGQRLVSCQLELVWLRAGDGRPLDPCAQLEALLSKVSSEGSQEQGLLPRIDLLRAECLYAKGEMQAARDLAKASWLALEEEFGLAHPWALSAKARLNSL